jgi:RimJ/RimL family protein N-acetyltransferase/N-acetylglutamate synthase-like GNAT family acetyltransferase
VPLSDGIVPISWNIRSTVVKSETRYGRLVLREAIDDDAEAVAALLRAADDARVVSADGIRHSRRTLPERARLLDLVAEADGAVVAAGHAGLDIWTTTEGAAWAFVTVDARVRRQGIGDALGTRLTDHLSRVGATKATSFFRWTEEGERWAVARGWSRLLVGPLIALDPRDVLGPSVPAGYRCVAMAEVAPEAAYEAVAAAVLDEPTPVPHDNVQLDDFLRDWNEPDVDLESSSAVVDEAGRVVAFSFLNVVGDRAQHGFTGTVAEHRGRGLATAAKRRALRTAADRGVTRVTTSNAEENAAMRAINRNLGFEPIGEHVIFGRDL